MKFVRTYTEEGNECLIPANTIEQIYKHDYDEGYLIIISSDAGNFEADYVDKATRDKAFNDIEKVLNG